MALFIVLIVNWVQLPKTRLREEMSMEKVEYYTVRPNLKQLYGKKVNENTVFDEKTEDGTVTQHFENLTLTTNIRREVKADEENLYEVLEESTITIKVPNGTILIWSEQEGFIVPQYQMCTLEDIRKDIDNIEAIYNEEN